VAGGDVSISYVGQGGGDGGGPAQPPAPPAFRIRRPRHAYLEVERANVNVFFRNNYVRLRIDPYLSPEELERRRRQEEEILAIIDLL
ncbi:MAG TPA: hypothetical protein VIG29_21040, partial [Vicinamibacteria bacterium]